MEGLLRKEVKINFGDLLRFLLKKWKAAVIFIIIGALIGGIFSYFDADRDLSENPQQFFEQLVKSGDIDLKKINTYNDYCKLYSEKEALSKSSVILGMDSGNVYIGSKTVCFKASRADINSVAARYTSAAESSDNLLALIEASGLDCSEAEMSALFTAELKDNTPSASSVYIYDYYGDTSSAVVKYVVKAPTQGSRDAMMEVLSDIVSDANEYCAGDFSGYWISDIYTNTYITEDSGIAQAQMDVLKDRSECLSVINSLYDSMNKSEKLYCRYIGGLLPENTGKLPKIAGMIAAGAIAGLIVGFLFVFFKYKNDPTVKSAEDISDGLGLNVIGSYNGENKEYIFTKLRELMDKRIVLSIDDDNPVTEEIISYIIEHDPRFVVHRDISQDADAFTEMMVSDRVVIVAKLWTTTKDGVAAQYNTAKSYGRKASDVLVIE